MQLVADVQNTATLRRQFFQHHKQLLHRLRREHRSRLVQYQQLRAGQERPDDFHALHLSHTQGVYRPGRVNVQTILSGLGSNRTRDLSQTQAFVQTEPDVLGYRDGVKQAEMLKHHA